MKINWVNKEQEAPENVKALLELEYSLRSELMKKLLLTPLVDDDDDIEVLSFDFHTQKKKFAVTIATPEPYYTALLKRKDTDLSDFLI
ncbi:hypothetical protein ACG2LH_07935 [Zhouia sp. PK063]|uniref:hypothetical protein n=1 Tax=Zhouia sp. PK063 TaxID=3373602 RepID=UPI0037B8CC66